MWSTVLCYLFCIVSLVFSNDAYNKALKERNRLIDKSVNAMIGHGIVLTDDEQKVSKIMMDLKQREIDYGFEMPQYFNYSKHFFKYRDEVKKTELFKIIQKMPKGALLHVHDTSSLNPDYVLGITYLDNLYVCFEGSSIQFLFSSKKPTTSCSTQWQLMSNARAASGNVTKFDANLRKHFTLVIDNPEQVYTDINAIWSVFMQYFIETTPLITYKPVFEKYYYDSLLSYRADNLMYVEVRSVLPVLYDLNGTTYNVIDTAASYKKVTDQFMIDYPDFFGAKLIYAPLRSVDKKTVEEYIETSRKLKAAYPDFFAGFDLTGQEDKGKPLKDFLPILSNASKDIDYFFHAGETDWFGTSTDENLVDAIVLNTKRIGHGYAILKYPVLIKMIKERGIAIEVNVVSNVVEGLVKDVRNHPLAALMAQNMPVVLSSDDPGVLESEPMSHDFYVAFIGVASRRTDLRLLKKLALNSLNYSQYPDKDLILEEFDIRWDAFIEVIVNENSK